MKVGDLVRQNGKMVKGNLKISTRVGLVLAIHEQPDWMKKAHEGWTDLLGRTVTVLWSNGKVHNTFAESALEVVSEGVISEMLFRFV